VSFPYGRAKNRPTEGSLLEAETEVMVAIIASRFPPSKCLCIGYLHSLVLGLPASEPWSQPSGFMLGAADPFLLTFFPGTGSATHICRQGAFIMGLVGQASCLWYPFGHMPCSES
jgi:hypothetical protein